MIWNHFPRFGHIYTWTINIINMQGNADVHNTVLTICTLKIEVVVLASTLSIV